ncbi:MAG TPA: ATP-binding protein [Pseudonocardiaceae bacterium]
MVSTTDPGRVCPVTVLLLVGPPGAGKSTLAGQVRRRWGWPVVCLDVMRAAVCGDAADLSATALAVQLAVTAVAEHLTVGRSVVIDATNAVAGDRRTWLDLAARHGARTVAVLILPSLATCQARNAGRTRVVPAEVVATMHGHVRGAVAVLPGEVDHLLTAAALRRLLTTTPDPSPDAITGRSQRQHREGT